MAEVEELLVRDRASWRGWLEACGTSSNGVWLVLSKSKGGLTNLTYEEALEEAICFGWIDGQIDSRDNQSYCRRFTPRRAKSRWSAKNVASAERLIASGEMTASGLAAFEAAKADGRWQEAYLGQAHASPPPEFMIALEQNPKAMSAYEHLSAAERYSITYRLGAIKNRNTQSQKIQWYKEALKNGRPIRSKRD